MKTNVKLIEDHERSSWDVTMENLKKLDLTLEDIAGLFYGNSREYRRIADDLINCTFSHNDIITNICLARIFHKQLSTFPQEKLGFIVKLANDLPFCMELFNAQHPKISLDVLKKSFEILYSKKIFWQNKDTAVSTKFHLWKFANTINRAYNNELYIINLDLIEKELTMDKEANDLFQEIKVDYFNSITQKQVNTNEIWKSILSEPDSHCPCC